MKSVFITGSSSGVGQHLVGAFLSRGYRVAASARNLEKLQGVANDEQWPTVHLKLITLDVANSDHWQQALAEVITDWGKIDIFLNVAGYLLPGYIHETPEEEIHKHIDTNVKGLMIGARRVAQLMLEQKDGHIINIASTAALTPVVGLGLYSSSKFAVRAFSLAMGQELSPLGVKVTVICPDAIDTPMMSLQEDYPESSLLFSGSRTLTVADIENAIFNIVIPKAPLEYGLPLDRVLLGKLANLLPGKFQWLEKMMRRRGEAVQKAKIEERKY